MSFTHRDHCVAPDSQPQPFRGKRGDLMRRCRECAAVEILETAHQPPLTDERPSTRAHTQPDAPDPSASRSEPPGQPRPGKPSAYRCRAHLTEPVTWRGKGCQPCADEQRARSTRRKRAAARNARQQEDAW